MSDLPPIVPPPVFPQGTGARQRPVKGFFPPRVVRALCFYIISLCIVASVVACILAIWDFTKKDSLWRLVASFVVVGGGTALFATVNGIFGDDANS